MIHPNEPDADFKMMKSPSEWPMWPRLPLKNTLNRDRVALLVNPYVGLFFVEKSMFERIERDELKKIESDQDLRALLTDGWVVD